MTETGKITIVPTPIGNLGDMTQRALDALRDADCICAEDTRVTGKLLSACGIKRPAERLDEATMSERAAGMIERALAGESIAYCSDAGMPGVSDPGMRLVRAARDAGVRVDVLPGASALTTAFVASGVRNASFFFGGFLPRKDQERRGYLDGLKGLDAALIFYESPKRLASSLESIASAYPTREVTVCRELTKMHEEVVGGNALEICAMFKERDAQGGIKGEIVIVVSGPTAQEAQEAQGQSIDAAKRTARDMAAQGRTAKSIAKALAAEHGISRNDAYEIALQAVKG